MDSCLPGKLSVLLKQILGLKKVPRVLKGLLDGFLKSFQGSLEGSWVAKKVSRFPIGFPRNVSMVPGFLKKLYGFLNGLLQGRGSWVPKWSMV